MVAISTLFLLYSFYPTYFEISQKKKIDSRREFILEHNFYWPDFNLYLSKIRQGWEGNFVAIERYTSEPHTGSLIQIFYVLLGSVGRILALDPNGSYQLGRIILSPLLAIIIILYSKRFFPSFFWQILSILIIFSSGSFPNIAVTPEGQISISRFMEWWSNIDSVQRISFLPHILLGQVGSFFLLYILAVKKTPLSTAKLLLLGFIGNVVGITFPPSLITLNGVLLILFLLTVLSRKKTLKHAGDTSEGIPWRGSLSRLTQFASDLNRERGIREWQGPRLKFIFLTFPSLFYIFFITKIPPWSALIEFHRTHPMMIPFDQYILGTGPIFFLGILGAFVAIFSKEKKYYPIILFVLVTFLFASVFSMIKEQSPLRFTQTGLFIPLGILATYFFSKLWMVLKSSDLIERNIREVFLAIFIILFSLFLITNLFMMTVSMKWQTTFITQRIYATIPLVPYPPQTMYPLKTWMDGIRWLWTNTKRDDVVLAEITAGNFIPAYAGNTVYFGQSNTVDYDRKASEVDAFFRGAMTANQAELFLKNGPVRYVFFAVQEKEKSNGKSLDSFYPFLKPVFSNPDVTIYTFPK